MPHPSQIELRFIALATFVAGALDLLSAVFFSSVKGVGPATVMQSVAAGPFGDEMFAAGASGVALGLAVHFAIMSVMALIFALTGRRCPAVAERALFAGILYGCILYGVMYWIVLPARWPSVHPRTGAWDVANAVFSHVVCVGIPMALIWRKSIRRHHGP